MLRSARRKPILIVSFLLASTAMFGCSTPNVTHVSVSETNDIVDRLKAGNVLLQCGFSCAGPWGASRADAMRYFEQRDWRSLAVLVEKVGFESDLTWYYLGVAAKELGSPDAATEYYRRAIATSNRCAAFIDVCDGINPQAAAKNELESLQLPSSDVPKPPAPKLSSKGNEEGANAGNASAAPKAPEAGQEKNAAKAHQFVQAAPTHPKEQQLQEFARTRRVATRLVPDAVRSSPAVATLLDAEPGSIGIPAAPITTRQMSDKERAIVREAAVIGLFDPFSARVTIETDRDQNLVCGHVNAKNRFGAYIGDHLVVMRVQRDSARKILAAERLYLEESVNGDAVAIVHNTDAMIACLSRQLIS